MEVQVRKLEEQTITAIKSLKAKIDRAYTFFFEDDQHNISKGPTPKESTLTLKGPLHT